MHETILGGHEGLTDLSARRDVAPGTDDFNRFPRFVADQLQLIANPAVVAILLPEAVLEGDVAHVEQALVSALNARQVLDMNAALPEARPLQIVLGFVAQQIPD